MIEYENTFGIVTISCDNDSCRMSDFTHDGFDGQCDLHGALEEAKEFGWITIKEDGEWYHYCSKECREQDNE